MNCVMEAISVDNEIHIYSTEIMHLKVSIYEPTRNNSSNVLATLDCCFGQRDFSLVCLPILDWIDSSILQFRRIYFQV